MNHTDDECSPNWINSGAVRQKPYTEAEIDSLAEGFIAGLDDDEWRAMMKIYGGEKTTKDRIRIGFIKLDENNIVNIEPKGPIH